MRIITALFAVALLSGCTAKLPDNTFQMNDAVLKERQKEMKMVDRQYNTLISDSISALQDMGFDIQKVDKDVGFIHASKSRELVSSFQAGAAEFGVNLLGAIAGVYTEHRQPQRINVNAYLLVDPKDRRCNMRTTFFNTTYDRKSFPLAYAAVEDEEIYQGFYTKIGKSSFLEDNLND
jgi:hypothetical protein